MTKLVWFRQDLRICDNPALAHACERGPVVGLYVLDDSSSHGRRLPGGASRWWLHHSLTALAKSLGHLVFVRGDPLVLVPEVAGQVGATGVYWNRLYDPSSIARDKALKSQLAADGFDVASFKGSLLLEPWEVLTKSGGPYKVYSAFWRASLQKPLSAETIAKPAVALSAPKRRTVIPDGLGESLADWRLLPSKPNWAKGFETAWQPGEAGAQRRLDDFLKTGLAGYRDLRDQPDLENVSRLSPHLHFGEISPRQVWNAIQVHMEQHPKLRQDAEKFLSELGWREFASYLLFHFPTLPEENWKPAFDAFPWEDNEDHLTAWQRGQTGYPMVDAGMRELWVTGYMHNRVRMIAASFLVKHLRIHWRAGEAWFWDTLVDADLANNVCGWQWVAGSGADAAPYFRIFNPIMQGRKFDPDGAYVRRWCPELAPLPNKFIHAPFEAPDDVLDACGVKLGQTYPLPLVDHARARAEALAGFEAMKDAAQV